MSVSARHRRVERGGLEIESRGGFDVISINPFSLRQVKPRSERGGSRRHSGEGCMKTPLLLATGLWEWLEGVGGVRILPQPLAQF